MESSTREGSTARSKAGAGSPKNDDSTAWRLAQRASALRPGPAGRRSIATFGGVALVWLFFSVTNEFFLTSGNVVNILAQSANVALIAAGLTVVLISAEIDLSIGALQAMAGAWSAFAIIQVGIPVWAGVLTALLLGLCLGLLNGLVTWKLRIPSFIATLAMLGIAQGTAFLLLGGRPIRGFPPQFRGLAMQRIGGISSAVFIAIAVLVLIHLVLQHTRFGRQVFAVGGDAEAAQLAGINVGRVKMMALALSGVTAAGGGLILSARLNAGDGRFGEQDLLVAVAAVVIGGTSLFGGVGSIAGTAAGVLMIASIKNGLVLMNVQDFWQRIAVGVIILAAMVVDQIAKGERRISLPTYLSGKSKRR